ncbi:glycohydrolase toxin TNT-related protein [Mycolicibacterium goodii]|uniref:glycohydrolase toxin TNT-related protein n=1 Tax=Mycolicibacterium goodii TaxID=134601 RepID=UPI00069E73F2
MPSDSGGVSGIRIEVDPQVLIRAGQSMSSLGKQLDMLMGALGPMLSSGIASGIDLAGLAMALEYGDLAQQFSDTLAGGANTFKAVGIKLQASGHNYANADAVSTIGGGSPTGSVDGGFEETTPVDARDSPSLSVVPPPPSWFLVASFLGPTAWPSGNPSMLRLTAAQWKNLASGFSAVSDQVRGSRTAVSTQKIPEASQVAEAHADLADGVADLADQATQIASTLNTFADNVQDTQDAIRRLLDRVSTIDGIVDTVKGIFTGDALDIIKEVVEDIRTLLENFQRQVKAVGTLLEALKGALNDTVTKFQKWADKNLREILGDQVGGAISDIIKFQTDLTTGVLSGVINTVAGTVAFADLDTWKGLGETALAVIKDPSLIDDIGIAAGKEFLAWDQLTGENPGRGIGEAGFNVASLFFPGGPLAKGGTVAKGVNKVRRAFDGADSPSVGLPGRHGLDGDLSVTGSRVSEVPEIRQGGIPDSVVNPVPPNRIDAPSSPNGLEAPVRPPDPPGPTTSNPGGGARPPGGGDGPPPDSPHRPVGPADPGPTRADSPPPHAPNTPESHQSASPSIGEPGIRGNSEPGYTPPPVDPSPQHAPEPATPAAQNDAPHTPAESNPKPIHESAASDAPASTHSPAQHIDDTSSTDNSAMRADDNSTSTDHHRPGMNESRSLADHQAHGSADQQPAHTPAADHPAEHDRNSVANSESRQPAYVAAAHDSQPAMAPMMSPGMGGGPPPMTSHTPGPVHGGGESHSPAAKSPAPDTSTRGPEARPSHIGSPETPRAQQPTATGPAPGTTPSAPAHPSDHMTAHSLGQAAHNKAEPEAPRRDTGKHDPLAPPGTHQPGHESSQAGRGHQPEDRRSPSDVKNPIPHEWGQRPERGSTDGHNHETSTQSNKPAREADHNATHSDASRNSGASQSIGVSANHQVPDATGARHPQHDTGEPPVDESPNSHGHSSERSPQNPLHSSDQSGPGWERLPDEPMDPQYGEPLPDHWPFDTDPVDPDRINPDVAKLITDPDAPYGRAPDGHAYTRHQYEERFNKLSETGSHWQNFPLNDGAVPGTKVAFTSFDEYCRIFGDQLDRIGSPDGKYLGVMEKGEHAPWESRAMHVESLSKPLHTYRLSFLPEGWKIEVSQIAPGAGQPGGGIQLRVLNEKGKAMLVGDLEELGVLE